MKNHLFTYTIKPLLFSILLSTALTGSFSVYAAQKYVTFANITQTLASSGYGGCMALLDINVKTIPGGLPNCNNNWVSLDCDAEYHTPEQASAMWDSALMAHALNRRVHVLVDDTQVVDGGYCGAVRIDVLD